MMHHRRRGIMKPPVSSGQNFGDILGIFPSNGVTVSSANTILHSNGAPGGYSIPYFMEFVDGTSTSSMLAGVPGICSNANASGCRLVAPFNLVVNSGMTVASVASGAMDATATSFGNPLVSNGCANAIIRIGWEMNQSQFPWGMTNTNGYPDGMSHPAVYVSAVQRIVPIFRAIAGNSFLICSFNVAVQQSSDSTAALFPGATYTDIVGFDVYDQVNPRLLTLATPLRGATSSADLRRD